MTESPIYVAPAAALLAALIALLGYHLLFARPALQRQAAALALHDEMLGGTGEQPATRRLASLEAGLGDLRERSERAEAALRELQALARTDVSRIGFVRYDAFEESSSLLSYALALLNREGDGVVLTSIYSRTDTRTYAKAVASWTPLTTASAEELDAITKARPANT